MSDQTSHYELEKEILGAVKEINVKNASHTAPVYSLTEILALKKINELRKLGKALHAKYCGNLPKPELISVIVETMKQEDTLRNCLYALDEIEWEFFQKVAAKNRFLTDKVYIESYHISQSMGLLQSFYHEDKLWFVVPEEIKVTYRKLTETDFPKDKGFRDLLNNYAIAAVSLYGVISQDDFVALFNSQNERQTNIDEIFSILINYVYADAGYCFWDEYIVDADFEEKDYAGVKRLLAERKSKSRYTPSRDEFIKYSDWDYYEVTPQLVTLKNHLSTLIADPEAILDIIDEIHSMCVAGVKTREYFEFLNSAGIIFNNIEQANTVMQLIVEVQNNTRLWINYGHTPNELFSTDKYRLLPFTTTHI